jgi:hypothetical protein
MKNRLITCAVAAVAAGPLSDYRQPQGCQRDQGGLIERYGAQQKATGSDPK